MRNVPFFSGVKRLGCMLLLLASPAYALAASGYAFRGVIFGPYGKPWSHADRLDMLPWMGAHGMNMYIHAAKDDVYQRLQWRDPYPADTLADFAEEIAAAGANGVAWVPNLSPGVPLIPSLTPPTGAPSRDICFSCDSDFQALVAKLQPFYDLGARTFMVSFDDVQKLSTHPEDALAFGLGDSPYGAMTATLLNRLQDHWPDSTILTVPAEYSGTMKTDYLTSFGWALDRRVRVMWTGTATVSHTIAALDAKAYSDAISTPKSGRRKLLIWDNFPVNDYNGNIFSSAGLPTNFKLNVGPYKGRGADLVEFIDGFFSNPMNEERTTKIPLYTIAAYLNDPTAYSDAVTADRLAEEAWVRGIEEFGGLAGGEALFNFVSQMRSTPMDRKESPRFVERWTAFQSAFGAAFWKDSWQALIDELSAEAAAAPTLRGLGPLYAQFLDETRNHLALLELDTRVGLLAARTLAAERPALDLSAVAPGPPGTLHVVGRVAAADPLLVARTLADLAPLEIEMRTSPYSVHGDRLQHDFGNIYLLENKMDDFTNFAHQATALWLPTAALAAAGPLAVTVNDVPAPLGADGSFAVDVPVAATVVVVVTDAAGYRTGEQRAVP